MGRDAARPHLGFACLWDPVPETTWSGSAMMIRRALARRTRVTDVGIELDRKTRALVQGLHARRYGRRWTSVWRYGAGFREATGAAMGRRATRAGCDVVLEIRDVAPVEGVPYLVYEDMSIDAVLAHRDPETGEVPYYPGFPLSTVLRIRDQQRRQFELAARVLTMSAWLATSLVENSGVPAEKVRVVHPGISSAAARDAGTPLPDRNGRPRSRLLFVGKLFYAKGGATVLEAVRILRDVNPDITLTICGPPASDRALPPGVEFLGPQPRDVVARLYESHDLLVVPSKMEAFGIVFVEALSRGMPCIGRNAFAMPEIITDGVNGRLFEGDDAEVLAKQITDVLADDAMYSRCRAQATEIAAHYSWDRAADEVLCATAEIH